MVVSITFLRSAVLAILATESLPCRRMCQPPANPDFLDAETAYRFCEMKAVQLECSSVPLPFNFTASPLMLSCPGDQPQLMQHARGSRAAQFVGLWFPSPIAAQNIRIQETGTDGRGEQESSSKPHAAQQDATQSEERQVNHYAAQCPGAKIPSKVASWRDFGSEASNRFPPGNLRTHAAVEGQQNTLGFGLGGIGDDDPDQGRDQGGGSLCELGSCET